MLSPNLTLTVQFLKNLSATVIPKQLTPRRRHRGKGGSPISSSLPRHGARIRTETQKQNQQKQKRKTKGRLQVSTKNNRTKIYMMHEQFKCHDACSNAVRLMFNLSSNTQHWLEHRVFNKNPKNLKNHLNNL